MTKYFKSLWDYFKQRTKSNIFLFILLALYFAGCIASCVYCIVIQRYRDIAVALIFALLVPVFYIGERNLKIQIPTPTAVAIILLCIGSFIGACYNFYTIFRYLDDVLHAMCGVVFTIIGFTLIKVALGEPDTKKKFFMYLLFGFAFCLMIAVLWEIYEFIADRISPNLDMQEDTIINSIHSFLLFPGYDHLHTEIIEGIAYTVLYDADGNVLYTIDGGYLDIGIMDTMFDIVWCTGIAVLVCVFLAVDRLTGSHLYRFIIPKSTADQ